MGFLFPIGKLIVLECLAVIQLSFFSILQFDKIAPTFIGLKRLIVSSGYNDPNISLNLEARKEIDASMLMGLTNNFVSNYNISFLLFFVVPLLIGLVGWLLTRPKDTPSKRITKDEISSNVSSKV